MSIFVATWLFLTAGSTAWAVLYARRLDLSNREASGAVRWSVLATLPGTCFLVELSMRQLLVFAHQLQSVAFSQFFTPIPSALGLAAGPVVFAISFAGFHPTRRRPWVDFCRGLLLLVWTFGVVAVTKSMLSV